MENENITLEEHRSRTVGEILNLWNTHDRVACVRYTGYGKTYYVLRKLLEILNNKTFLILIPNENLVNKYKKMFCDLNNVTLNTYQYIALQDTNDLCNLYPNLDYIICDECHHLSKNKWGKQLNNFIEANNSIKLLGLTATPIRRDSINVVDEFFNGIETSELDLLEGIKRKYTNKIKYVRAICRISDNYSSRLNDIDRYKLSRLVNVPDILKKHIPKEYIENNYKILLFISRCDYIQEASKSCKEWFKEAFPNKNINIYYMGYTETKQFNANQRHTFEDNDSSNDIDILISVNKLSEGDHIPKVHTVMMLRKTSSFIVFNQQMGRAINGKEPLILDLVNNSDKLYTNTQEYNVEIDSNGSTSREKVMFDDYCTLIDETKEIKDILKRYYSKREKISSEMEQQIINETNLTIDQIATKYGIARATVSKIRKRNGLTINNTISDDVLIEIVTQHRDYIETRNGIIPRKDIAEYVRLTLSQLERGMKLIGIEPKRMHPKIVPTGERLKDVKKLAKSGNSATAIKEKLDVSMREVDICFNLLNLEKNKRRSLTDDDKIYILNNYKTVSLNQMRIHLGFKTDNRIRNFLKSRGIEINKKPVEPITESEELKICKIFERVGSLYKTRLETGRHKATIKKILLKHGYTVRKGTR